MNEKSAAKQTSKKGQCNVKRASKLQRRAAVYLVFNDSMTLTQIRSDQLSSAQLSSVALEFSVPSIPTCGASRDAFRGLDRPHASCTCPELLHSFMRREEQVGERQVGSTCSSMNSYLLSRCLQNIYYIFYALS